MQQKILAYNQDQSLHHATWAKQDLIIIETFNSFNIVYALSFSTLGMPLIVFTLCMP